MAQNGSIRTNRGLQKLQLLRTYNGSPDKFWMIFLDSISDLTGADSGFILEKNPGQNSFKILASYDGVKNAEAMKTLQKMVPDTLAKSSDKKVTVFSAPAFSLLTLPLMNESGTPTTYVLIKIMTADPGLISAASIGLTSVADIPLNYNRQIEAAKVLQHHEKILNVLDLNVQLNSQTRFLSAGMVLCNELASAYKCNRVSLGWRKGNFIRLKAMSQADHFEKKMEIIQKAEAAMEESAEQNTEIYLPFTDNDGSLYVRDHENYLKSASVDALLSVPVRYKNEVVGICLLEKNGSAFTEDDMHHLRMLIDQVTARLYELYLRDRWIGIRIKDWIKEKLALVLSFEHTWIKLIAIVTAVLLIIMATVPVRYRVDSPMILKTDDITFLAAPFDGYISTVSTKAGESVTKEKVILSLDKKDLILESAGLKAEYTKVKREEDKYRADQKLAEMRIAQSQIEQLHSRLDIVELRLSQADIKAPFTGIIIEGDQHERIGSPVQQGEVLFKLGRIEDIRVEAKVSENEIDNIKIGASGQIALASHPNQLFDITVQRIEPAAVSDPSGNVFQIVCFFDGSVPQWFRPGMTGISKIDAGKRTLFWIISHSTSDFLRLKFWW